MISFSGNDVVFTQGSGKTVKLENAKIILTTEAKEIADEAKEKAVSAEQLAKDTEAFYKELMVALNYQFATSQATTREMEERQDNVLVVVQNTVNNVLDVARDLSKDTTIITTALNYYIAISQAINRGLQERLELAEAKLAALIP